VDDVNAYLQRLRDSALGPSCILRGSQLTARWIPGRVAGDLDFLLAGEWTVEQALKRVAETAPGARVEVIWAETEWPGVRLNVDGLQVDFGWDEQLAAPPRPFELHGTVWPAVTAEVMFGWKAHSLVERGPRGRWHAKT